MDHTSKCDGDGTTTKKRRSGKSNWAKFNEQRKNKVLRKKGLLPSHRLHGKQPLQPKPLQTQTVTRRRVIQRAIRLESPIRESESEAEDADDEGNFEEDGSHCSHDSSDHHDILDAGFDGSFDGARPALLSGCVSDEEFTN